MSYKTSLFRELKKGVKSWLRSRDVIVSINCLTDVATLASGKEVQLADSRLYECGTTVAERQELLAALREGKPVYFTVQVEGSTDEDELDFVSRAADDARMCRDVYEQLRGRCTQNKV